MRKIFIMGAMVTVLFFGCGKKQQKNELARNYYSLSTVELEETQTDHAYKKALSHVELALEQLQKPEYLARKATLLFLLKREQESIACFKKALSCKMNDRLHAEILNNYACVLGKCGKTDEALHIFQELEQSKDYLTPEVALVNQGKIYLERGEFTCAKEKLLIATQLAHEYVDAHYYLAMVSYLSKDLALARQEAQTVTFLAPEHIGARELQSIAIGQSPPVS